MFDNIISKDTKTEIGKYQDFSDKMAKIAMAKSKSFSIHFKLRVKMIATEITEITEFFFSVSSVLSVADNINNDPYKFYCPTF